MICRYDIQQLNAIMVIYTMSSSGEKASLITLLRMKTILLLSILISNLGGSPGVLFLDLHVCMYMYITFYVIFSSINSY